MGNVAARGQKGICGNVAARGKIFSYHCAPCGTNVFIVTLCALRPKKLETCDPKGSGMGILGEFVPPGAKYFHTIVRLAEQMFSL